jgi:hypothetical protein
MQLNDWVNIADMDLPQAMTIRKGTKMTKKKNMYNIKR